MGMELINGLVINLIYLLFPLTMYTIYISYITSFSKEEKDIYLDLALFSSLFLILKFGSSNYLISSLLFINMPLLIAYIKNRKITALLISSILIFNDMLLNIPFIYVFLEYIMYFIIYIIFEYKNIDKIIYLPEVCGTANSFYKEFCTKF